MCTYLHVTLHMSIFVSAYMSYTMYTVHYIYNIHICSSLAHHLSEEDGTVFH